MSIALWCVLFGGVLPILIVGASKVTGGTYDNHRPRESAARFEGRPARLYAAHLNAFEAFPLFAAAVIVAETQGGSRGLVDTLALVWVAARLAHAVFYGIDQATLRSLAWSVAWFAAIAIFLTPVFA